MTEMGVWTVILGEARYRVEPAWATLPGGKPLEALSQVAVDSHGHVYALLRADPPIAVFDPDGRYIKTMGEGLILDSHGIAVDSEDRIWVVDRDAHQIVVFDRDGGVVKRLGERGVPRLGAPFNHPTGVGFAADGEVYVSDGYGNARVHRFSPNGSLLGSWGEPGRDPGQFSTPHAVLVDRSDRVLVADRENDRIQVFDRDGALLTMWGDVYRPMGLFETPQGILVSDQVPRVTLFSPDGRVIGRCRPVLNGAHGICGSPDGSIYCAEMVPPRLTRLAIIPA